MISLWTLNEFTLFRFKFMYILYSNSWIYIRKSIRTDQDLREESNKSEWNQVGLLNLLRFCISMASSFRRCLSFTPSERAFSVNYRYHNTPRSAWFGVRFCNNFYITLAKKKNNFYIKRNWKGDYKIT